MDPHGSVYLMSGWSVGDPPSGRQRGPNRQTMLGKIGSPKSGLDPLLFGEIFFRFDGLRRQKTVFQTIKWAGMDAAMACSAFAVS